MSTASLIALSAHASRCWPCICSANSAIRRCSSSGSPKQAAEALHAESLATAVQLHSRRSWPTPSASSQWRRSARPRRRLRADGSLFSAVSWWVAVVGAKEPTIGVLQASCRRSMGSRPRASTRATIHEQFLVGHQYALIASFVISNLGALRDARAVALPGGRGDGALTTPSRIASQLALFGADPARRLSCPPSGSR